MKLMWRRQYADGSREYGCSWLFVLGVLILVAVILVVTTR